MLRDRILSREATIEVLGLGYIGLSTAVLFADAGFNVIGVDVNRDIIEALSNGNTHITEPELDRLLRMVVRNGKLHVSTVTKKADVFLICVPTPITEDKKADLSYVKDAANSLVPVLERRNLVVLESTVPPGTTVDVLIPVLETSGLKVGEDIYVAHCPERVLPGKIIKEAVENNRIVGGVDNYSSKIAAELYRSFVKGEVIETDATTAEMCKLAENTYRDVNIALANELSMLCDKLGIDVWKLIRFANKHPRVNILQPGPGVGGHCIAVDPWFIVEKFPEDAKLIQTARKVNDAKPRWVADKIESLVNDKGKTVGILGIAYKPDVGDIRESPSLKIMHILINGGYSVKVFDPCVDPKMVNFQLCDIDELLEESSVIVLLVGHTQFRTEDFKKKIVSCGKPLLDVVGIFSGQEYQISG